MKYATTLYEIFDTIEIVNNKIHFLQNNPTITPELEKELSILSEDMNNPEKMKSYTSSLKNTINSNFNRIKLTIESIEDKLLNFMPANNNSSSNSSLFFSHLKTAEKPIEIPIEIPSAYEKYYYQPEILKLFKVVKPIFTITSDANMKKFIRNLLDNYHFTDFFEIDCRSSSKFFKNFITEFKKLFFNDSESEDLQDDEASIQFILPYVLRLYIYQYLPSDGETNFFIKLGKVVRAEQRRLDFNTSRSLSSQHKEILLKLHHQFLSKHPALLPVENKDQANTSRCSL